MAITVTLLSPSGVEGQQPKPGEYQVKAAYLYNFGKFVSWSAETPATRSDSFSICVIGQDPFGSILDMTLSGETIGGKGVVAKRVSRIPDIAGCRILFISLSEESRLGEVLGAVAGSGALTVSDISEFAQRGGMIQFVLQGNKVRFEVALLPAEQAGLTLSSELLRVAANVRRNPRRGN